MDCSMPGFPVHHQFLELAQTYVCRVGDAIQPSHPLSSLSPLAFSLFQHPGLFKWVNPLHQVVQVLELQLQNQSLQWIIQDFHPWVGKIWRREWLPTCWVTQGQMSLAGYSPWGRKESATSDQAHILSLKQENWELFFLMSSLFYDPWRQKPCLEPICF